MKKIILYTGFLTLIVNIAFSQSGNAGYKFGNDSVCVYLSRVILKSNSPPIWVDSNLYVIAFIEIGKHGGIENVTLTSIKDTVFTSLIYHTIMGTSNNWFNNSGTSQFFEIPFQFLYSKSDSRDEIDQVPYMNTVYYRDGEMVNFTKFKPITYINYPPQR